jgi:hypothetical protein
MPTAAAGNLTPLSEEELDDEPEIPEYLIAEQRRGRTPQGAPGGQAGRGGHPGRGGARSGYAAAIDRERYGRGGGGGINRYPDVSGREGGHAGGPRRDDFRRAERPAPVRAERPAAGRPNVSRGDEPWSEVPPELAEMLRAQVAGRGRPAPEPGSSSEPKTPERQPKAAEAPTSAAVVEAQPTDAMASRRGRSRVGTTRRVAPTAAETARGGSAVPEIASDAAAPTPKRRGGRPKASAEAGARIVEAAAAPAAPAPDRAPAPRRTRTARSAPVEASVTADALAAGDGSAAPTRRRISRLKVAASDGTSGASQAPSGAAPKPRTTRSRAKAGADGA